jgi:ABC-type Mn2+/Zn2+ transport system ATPase subunit
MDIELTSGNYKSIKSLKWEEIPDFVVVTGKNGSGKTQLLELIHHQLGTDKDHKNNIARNPINPFYGVVLDVRNFNATAKEVVYLPATWSLSNLGAINASSFTETINTLHNTIIGMSRNSAYAELAEIVKEKIGKPSNTISLQDVQNNLPLDHFDYINRIQLHEGLNEIFLGYHLKSAELRDLGESPEEIEQELGVAPWTTINNLLESAEFPYEVTKPRGYIGDFNFQLTSREDPTLVIEFNDLSSGEKILISLGIWMFNSGQAKRLPKLLLLDEPDAHLHPSVVKDFIKVIERTLVNKHGVKVIITTHSPTTVSFSPEYSLYEMSKVEPQIRPLESKEYGINLLTEGLVVVKSNNKYVLVEDHDDAEMHRIDAEFCDHRQEHRRADHQHRRKIHEGTEQQQQYVDIEQERVLVARDRREELDRQRRHAHQGHHVAERHREADHDHHHADRTHHAGDEARHLGNLVVAIDEKGDEERVDAGDGA